jgi:hypothetical protein
MKFTMMRIFLMGALVIISVANVKAQVTIGSSVLDANPGSLLDLKEYSSDQSVTSTRGMMLPRVRLTDLNELYPMLQSPSNDEEKAAHIGLTVYNVGKSWEPSGIYVWDGAKWAGIGVESTVKPPYYTCEPTYYEPDATKSVAITVNEPATSGTRTLRFLTYNLGANPNMTVKEQMEYTSGGTDDITIFGGLYQWGRKDAEHSLRCAVDTEHFTKTLYPSADYDPETSHAFVWGMSSPYDWITLQKTDLWGNGGGTSGQEDTNYPSTQNINNPCPDGFRVPTQYEWALLGHDKDGSGSAMTGDQIDYPPASGSSGNSSGIVWVPVSEGKASTDWVDGATCGYALYLPSQWDINDPYEGDLTLPEAPEPLLFLPAGGYRNYSNGNVEYTGSRGNYWSSVVYSIRSHYMDFRATGVNAGSFYNRAYGASVRCSKE